MKGRPTQSAPPKRDQSDPPGDDLSDSTPLWPPPASITQLSDPHQDSTSNSAKPSRSPGKARHNPQSDDFTASSTRSDSASIAAILVRLQEFDKVVLQSQKSELKQVAATSTNNFKHLEHCVERLDHHSLNGGKASSHDDGYEDPIRGNDGAYGIIHPSRTHCTISLLQTISCIDQRTLHSRTFGISSLSSLYSRCSLQHICPVPTIYLQQ